MRENTAKNIIFLYFIPKSLTMTRGEICKLLLSQDTPSWFRDPNLEETQLPPQMPGAIILAMFCHQCASIFYFGGRKRNEKRGTQFLDLSFRSFTISAWWYSLSITLSLIP